MGIAPIGLDALTVLGERLCVDFVDTVDWRDSSQPEEFLTGFADLVAWCRRVAVLQDAQATQLLALATQRPAEATATYDRAIELREALYRTLRASANGRRAQPADMAIINRILAEALAHLRVEPSGDGYRWEWIGTNELLDSMLWPIVRSAADLLVSPELRRVRMCAGDGCGWLFIDTSKNQSRRWCTMQSCGNRAKARRHYQRHRGVVRRDA